MAAISASAIDEMHDIPLSSLDDVRARRHELVARINASTPEQQPLAFEALHSYFEESVSDEQRAAFTDYESCLGEIGVNSILPINADRLLLYFASLDSETDYTAVLELMQPVIAAIGGGESSDSAATLLQTFDAEQDAMEVDVVSVDGSNGDEEGDSLEKDELADGSATSSMRLPPPKTKLKFVAKFLPFPPTEASTSLVDPFQGVVTLDQLYEIREKAVEYLSQLPHSGKQQTPRSLMS